MHWETKASSLILAIISLLFIGQFYMIAFSRIDYQYDLEWMEGGAVDHTVRVTEGKSLYVEPSADFVPYIYTPLSYYMAAGLSVFTGEGYVAGRLLSILAITGCFVLLYLLCYRETRDHMLSLLPAGILCVAYPICHNWFDIGRVDSLFLFFLLLGLYWISGSHDRRYLIGSAVAFYLAFMTKQSALLFYPMACLIVLCYGWKRALWFGTILGGLTGITVLAYNLATDGWFHYYVFTVGSGHEILDNMYIDFWKLDLWHQFKRPVILSFLAGLWLLYRFRDKDSIFYLSIATGFIGMSYFGRLHSGGDMNVVMPAFAAIGLLIPILYKQLRRTSVRIPLMMSGVVLTAYLGQQLWDLRYESETYVPSKSDWTAGKLIVEEIESVPGPVMINSHGYWQRYAGKETNVHFMAAHDIDRSSEHPAQQMLRQSILDRIESQYYDMIIQDNDYYIDEVLEYYELKEEIQYRDERAFMPVSGAQLRPTKIYVRKGMNENPDRLVHRISRLPLHLVHHKGTVD